jgi:outer membrane receptor for monomeric catechols
MKPENTRSCTRASNHWLAWLVASVLIASTPALAQEPRSDAAATAPAMAPTAAGAPHRLEPVIVTAPRIASEADQVPAAVSTVENRTIQQGRAAVKLNNALDRVPGVFIQNEDNFAQDMRVSIRGFGTRSAFGVRGIQILVDGLPHTLPDGQSAFDTIEPTAIHQMEVMRGPVSALVRQCRGRRSEHRHPGRPAGAFCGGRRRCRRFRVVENDAQGRWSKRPDQLFRRLVACPNRWVPHAEQEPKAPFSTANCAMTSMMHPI